MRKICGEDNVHKSHTRYPKYYLVEAKDNIVKLNKFRKSRVSYTASAGKKRK